MRRLKPWIARGLQRWILIPLSVTEIWIWKAWAWIATGVQRWFLLHLVLILWVTLIKIVICASYIVPTLIRDLIYCFCVIAIRIFMKVERMRILGLCLSALILILLLLSNICEAESWRMLRDNNGRVYLEKNSVDAQSQTFNIPAPPGHNYESSTYSSPDDGSEIDPRYGVEKRLVPTGPNPLHHWNWPWSHGDPKLKASTVH